MLQLDLINEIVKLIRALSLTQLQTIADCPRVCSDVSCANSVEEEIFTLYNTEFFA